MDNKLIVGIPGCWKDRQQIVQSIAQLSGGYLFAGAIIMKPGTDEIFELEVHEHNPSLSEAFRYASQGRLSHERLAAIRKHTYTLYVIGQAGSIDHVNKMIQVVSGLLKSGGIAVKIENSGTALSYEQWIALDKRRDLLQLFHAFVTYARDERVYYSCGMHVFGLPDATVTAEVSPDEADYVMTNFLFYCLNESPSIQSNQTFCVAVDQPTYIIQHAPCEHFQADELFYNPYGVWNLTCS